VDPGGVIAASIEPERVVGSLAYFATDIAEPGVIHHTEGQQDEPRRAERDAHRADQGDRRGADRRGLRCPVTTRFRHEIWVKLLGNVAFNPISASPAARWSSWSATPRRRRWCARSWRKPKRWPAKLGIELSISIDQRMAGAEKVGAHKTSMLQDYEAGRPMELEAVVGAVIELGTVWGTDAGDAGHVCLRPIPRRRARRAARAPNGGGSAVSINNRWFQLCASLIAMIMIANLQYAWTLFVHAAAGRHGWKLSDIQFAFTALHPLPDLGPAARRLADRRLGPRGFISRRASCADSAGRAWATPRRCRCSISSTACRDRRGVRLQRVDRLGAEMVQGSPRPGVGIMAAGFGGGTALFIPFISSMLKTSGHQATFVATGLFQGLVILIVAQVLRHPPAEAASAVPAAGVASQQLGKRQFTTLEMLRTPQFYAMYVAFVLMSTAACSSPPTPAPSPSRGATRRPS
jgi:hypothetical protein